MRRYVVTSLALGLCVSAALARVEAPDGALLSLDRPGAMDIQARWSTESREMTDPDTRLGVDFEQAVAILGLAPTDFIHLRAGAGWARADRPDNEGNGGFTWLAEGTLSLAELILEASPVVGTQQRFNIEVDAAYEAGRSNAIDTFRWRRRAVAGRLRYTLNLYGADPWRRFGWDGLSIHTGVLWERLHAKQGAGPDLTGNRDFAFLTGLTLQWQPGWVLRLNGAFYDHNDRRLDAALGYLF